MAKAKKILVVGSSNTDMSIKSDTLPLGGQTVLGGQFRMGAGGKGANQAVAAKRLGGDVTFICKVGDDLFGNNSIKSYSNEGIVTDYILKCDQPSGVALILVDDKAENCISVAPGANAEFSVRDVETLAGVIRTCDILLLQLEIPVASIFRAAQIASQAGKFVILNPAPACRLPEEIFQYVDLFTPNQTEAEFYTGIEVSDTDSAAEAAASLRNRGVKNVIITMGSKGSMTYTASGDLFVPSRKVKAVDTTAAGDTFCGAVAVALSEGMSYRDSVTFATEASSLTVQKPGAQDSIPYRKDLSL